MKLMPVHVKSLLWGLLLSKISAVYATSLCLFIFLRLLGSAGESPVPPHAESAPAAEKLVTPSPSPRPPSEPELPPSPPSKVEEPPPLPEERQPEGQSESAAPPVNVHVCSYAGDCSKSSLLLV